MSRLLEMTRGRAARLRADAAALSVVGLLFAAIFGPVVAAGKFLVAGDAYYQSYPLRTIAFDAIRRGEPPLWTPFVFSGYPLLSMSQTAVGYPPTWLYLLVPGHWAEQAVVLIPFLLAPAFTYAFARETGRGRVASLAAGLTFAYGGMMCGKVGGLGLMANSAAWLPLFLLAVERARRAGFTRCLLLATFAYSMSVLAGQGQTFLLVGMTAAAYAIFVALFPAAGARVDHGDAGRGRARWRPLAVASGALVLSAGVAAFQILETARAARRSVRSSLDFETFTYGAFTPAEAVKSFLAPVYHYIEVSTYVAPLAALLAGFAVARALRRGEARGAIFFWLALACVSFVLMLGASTPLYRLLHRVPVINLFRYPSRHAFEWTFALSMLAAHGWDALAAAVRPKRRPTAGDDPSRRGAPSRARDLVAALLLLAAGVAVALLWSRDATARPLTPNFGLDSGLIPSLPEGRYLIWKLAFTAAVSVLVWRALVLASARWRAALSAAAVALGCFAEPRILLAHVWFPHAKEAAAFTSPPPVTRWLQQYDPARHRVYTRANLFVRGYASPPPFDLPNMTAVRGLHNVAGYEQLILARYSRALGDAGADAVNRRYGVAGGPDETLFSARSRVLDLLNATHVVTFSNLATSPRAHVRRGAALFAADDLARALAPGETARLAGGGASGDTLLLVTALSNSVNVAQGETVALVRARAEGGEAVARELRAGPDTAEWAHERADVRPAIKHALAPVFDSTEAAEGGGSFPAHRYLASVPLGAPRRVEEIEITNVSRHATLTLWKATLFDSERKWSAALTGGRPALDASRWARALDYEGVEVWENRRALPRAWLVAEAASVDGEEALKMIRGESGREFDPRRTALLEVAPDEMPRLPGGEPPGEARIVAYGPSSLIVETDARSDALLVLSEIYYPGWEAAVDGRRAPIHLTNFLLRSVHVPAGRHRVEMSYRAPAARNGAIISALTLALLVALAAARRRRPRQAAAPVEGEATRGAG
jgi:hypothetical protein